MKDKLLLKLYRLLSDITSSKFFNRLIGNYVYKDILQPDRISVKKTAIFVGFENKYYNFFHGKVYDYIDYVNGPSDGAEKSAARTGFYNLEFAVNTLNYLVSGIGYNELKIAANNGDRILQKEVYKKRIEYKRKLQPIVLAACGVKKY